MHRFYVPDALQQGRFVQLDERESHHASQVLRLKPGEIVTVLDGAGHECDATAKEVKRRSVTLEVSEQRYHAPFAYRVTLIQSLPKGKAFDNIVQKATELGASRIIPIVSERTVVHVDEEASEQKLLKWRSIAVEAIKQCGSPWLPQIDVPCSLPDFLRRKERFDLPLAASLQEGIKHPSVYFDQFNSKAGRRPATVSIWIGPEGDFTPEEIQMITEQGAHPVTLGPLVLRSDTAAIYCLSIINYELQKPA